VRSKTASSGQRALRAELEKRGCPASDTQIERWSHWRGDELVPRLIRHGKGRGTYSKYADLSETADRVCEVHQLRSRYKNLDEIALVVAARGRPIAPESTRQALLAVLDAMEHGFRSHSGDSNDPHEVAYKAFRALTRAWSRGSNAAAKRATNPSPLAGAARQIAGRMLVGLPIQPSEFNTFLEGSGIVRIVAALGIPTDNLAATLGNLAPRASFDNIRATVEQGDPSAIVAALQTANRVLGTPFLRFLFPTETARDVTIVGCAIGFLIAGAHSPS
jgi:hypothetical protein